MEINLRTFPVVELIQIERNNFNVAHFILHQLLMLLTQKSIFHTDKINIIIYLHLLTVSSIFKILS